MAVAELQLAPSFLVVQVLEVRGGLSLALQPVLAGTHTADVVAAGIVGPLWEGDPFLCAVLVAEVHPLDLYRVMAAREKVDEPLVHPHHGGKVVPALVLDQSPLWQTVHD